MVQANGFSGSGIISGPAALTVGTGGGGGGGFTYVFGNPADEYMEFIISGENGTVQTIWNIQMPSYLVNNSRIGKVVTVSGITGTFSYLNGTSFTVNYGNNMTEGSNTPSTLAAAAASDPNGTGQYLYFYDFPNQIPGMTWNWN